MRDFNMITLEDAFVLYHETGIQTVYDGDIEVKKEKMNGIVERYSRKAEDVR